MDLSIKNTYAIADDTIENVSSLMGCTDAQRLSLNEMTFGEFTSANVPTLLTGSYATVNGALTVQAGSDGTPLYIANAQGSTFQDVSAAPANTTLYLCLIPSAASAVTYALKACASVYFDAARRGFYEVGTQNRVFGECRKVSGSWPASYKRLYTRPEILENYLKMYSDGLEINARKVMPAASFGRIATVYDNSTPTDWGSGVVTMAKLRVDYPSILEVVFRCNTYVQNGAANGTVSSAGISSVLMDSVTRADISAIAGGGVTAPSDSSQTSDITTLIPLCPGYHHLRLSTGVYHRGQFGEIINGIHTDRITAYIRDAVGNRLGEWGAVL